MIDGAIEKILDAPYTPSNSLAVDALLVLKELVEAKRMDRVLEHQSDSALPSSPFDGDAPDCLVGIRGLYQKSIKEKGFE